MNDEHRERLEEISNWLQNAAEERVKMVLSRRGEASSMREADPEDLKAAKTLAEKMSGRKMPNAITTTESAVAHAEMQDRVAQRIEMEAIKMSKWSEFLAALAASPTEKPAGDKPDPALLVSIAIRLRHDFGLLSESEKTNCLAQARQVWEEVMGRGFYRGGATMTPWEDPTVLKQDAGDAPSGEPGTSAPDAQKLLADWMIEHSYATGHGDTLADLVMALLPQLAAPGQGEARTALSEEQIQSAMVESYNEWFGGQKYFEPSETMTELLVLCGKKVWAALQLATGNSQSGAQMKAATPAPERAAKDGQIEP
jgi:hypothetical protein